MTTDTLNVNKPRGEVSVTKANESCVPAPCVHSFYVCVYRLCDQTARKKQRTGEQEISVEMCFSFLPGDKGLALLHYLNSNAAIKTIDEKHRMYLQQLFASRVYKVASMPIVD